MSAEEPEVVVDPAAVAADAPAEPESKETSAAEEPSFDGDAIDKLLAQAIQEPEKLDPVMRVSLEQQVNGERLVTDEQIAQLTPEGKAVLAAVLAKIQKANTGAEEVKSALTQQAEAAEAARVAAADERAKAFDFLQRPEVTEHRKQLQEQVDAQIPDLEVPPEVQKWLDAKLAKAKAEMQQEFYGNLDKTQQGRLVDAEAAKQDALKRAYHEDFNTFYLEHQAEFEIEGQVVPERRLVQTADGKQAEQVVNVPKKTPLYEAMAARLVASGAHPTLKDPKTGQPWRYSADFRDAYRLAMLDLSEQAEKGTAEAAMKVARERVIQPANHGRAQPTWPDPKDFDDPDKFNAANVAFIEANPEAARRRAEERFGRRTV